MAPNHCAFARLSGGQGGSHKNRYHLSPIYTTTVNAPTDTARLRYVALLHAQWTGEHRISVPKINPAFNSKSVPEMCVTPT